MNKADKITNIECEIEAAEIMLGLTETRTAELKNEIETKVAILKALKGD